MFDIGMTELLVIAVVAIIVVGPKDLPGLLRNGAKYLGQIRSLARDFQGQVNEAIKESELDGVKDTLNEVSNLNPVNQIKNEVNDYMESARALDEPDEDYIADGEALKQAEAIDAGVPAKEKVASETKAAASQASS